MSFDPKGNHPNNAECHAFTQEICCGNKDAAMFCALWYNYCHGIDDIIDTKEDGRPTMSNEQILGIFANAALLYNCPFFIAHRSNLFPIALMVTNMYADSVLWEKSPINRRRIMADAMRTCGDEMLFMVALICGGWEKMRDISPRIRERDWELQHDENDQPN